ncbi:MAG: helix-hairpin-helix domain-containing protein [Acidobacteria bacterium]|nr:helix-hairpin-helix domain-containing protein [Acidobacteriota bacterium]
MKKWLAMGALLMVASACRHLFGQQAATGAPATSISIEDGAAAIALIDLNLATGTELCRLPGIGPVMADRIIALRRQLNRFERIDQLLLIPGMSERKFRKIAPFVQVDRHP